MMLFERGGQKTILVATLLSFPLDGRRDGGGIGMWSSDPLLRDDHPPEVKGQYGIPLDRPPSAALECAP
jgi:hypothetical protein